MEMGAVCSGTRMQANNNNAQASASASGAAPPAEPAFHFDSCTRTVIAKTKLIGRHRWSIEGFSALPVQRTVSCTSPPFTAGGKRWELFVHNDGHSDQYAGCVSVFLQLLEPHVQGTVNCGFRFTLLHPTDASKNVTKPSVGQKLHTFKVGDTNWGFYSLENYKRLASEKYLWPNDAFVVELELEEATGQTQTHEHMAPSYVPSAQHGDLIAALSLPLTPSAPCSCALRHDIAELLRSGATGDILLLVGPAQESMHAHRGVLEARSSVFRAMFSSHMKDSREETLVIPDATPGAFRALLEFVYCDALPDHLVLTFAMALEVFTLADRWDLDRLTELVVPIISRHLSVANVYSALQFADAHSHCTGGARLKRVAVEFSRQHFEEVLAEGASKFRRMQSAMLEAQEARSSGSASAAATTDDDYMNVYDDGAAIAVALFANARASGGSRGGQVGRRVWPRSSHARR